MTTPVINTIVLSKRNINENVTEVYITYTPSITTNSLSVVINSTLAIELRVLIKIEIIST